MLFIYIMKNCTWNYDTDPTLKFQGVTQYVESVPQICQTSNFGYPKFCVVQRILWFQQNKFCCKETNWKIMWVNWWGADKLVLLQGAYLQRWLGANLKWGETFSYQIECKLLQWRPQSSNGEASMQIVNFCFWYLKFSLWIKCFSCRRPGDENHPAVKPDGYVDNLAQAVELILKYNWAEYYTEWMNWCVKTKDSLVSSKKNVDIGKERKEFKSVRIGFVHQYVHHLIGLVTNQGA